MMGLTVCVQPGVQTLMYDKCRIDICAFFISKSAPAFSLQELQPFQDSVE